MFKFDLKKVEINLQKIGFQVKKTSTNIPTKVSHRKSTKDPIDKTQ